MRKKLFILFIAFAASVCFAVGLSACSLFGEGGGHTHTMTYHPAVEATCTEDGNLEYWSCSGCGKNFADEGGTRELTSIVVAATGHSWSDWTVTTEPDCETEGERTRTCSRCHTTESETIDALEHSWGGWANDGDTHVRICENCGDEDRQAHTFRDGFCTVCDEPEVELWNAGPYYVVTGLGHSDGSDVVIPSEYNGIKVTEINGRAFNEEPSLESIYIPASVQKIGESAFWGCANLKTVTFDDGSLLTSIGNNAFQKCTSLEEIALGDYVQEIKSFAFDDSTSLKKVTLANSVTNIESSAFAYTPITEITIPESVQIIGGLSFCCSELTSIKYNAVNAQYAEDFSSPFDNAGKNTDGVTVVIGDKVETIPNKLFSNTNLAEIQFGSSLQTIGEYAFSRCGENITEFTIPASVTTIGAYAFQNCSVLESVTIEGAPTIGNKAFYECAALKEIDLGGATEIGESAFRGCTALTQITIPDSVTVIGEEAFYGCEELASVGIGDGTQTISSRAFFNCRKLSEVTLGDGLLTIEGYAFNNCSALKMLTIPASVTKIERAAFAGVSFDSVIFEQPSGWTEVVTGEAIARSVLSDPASAAEYISGYKNEIAREV